MPDNLEFHKSIFANLISMSDLWKSDKYGNIETVSEEWNPDSDTVPVPSKYLHQNGPEAAKSSVGCYFP